MVARSAARLAVSCSVLLLVSSCVMGDLGDTTAVGASAAAPTFSAPGGVYASPQKVTIETGTSGAVILYSLDDSTPSLVYTEALRISSSLTLRALARRDDLQDSPTASAGYVIGAPAAPQPQVSPEPGAHASAFSVTLSCTAPSPIIFYTTDGSAPTRSSAPYSTPIAVTTTTTVRAICTASGYADSAVTTAAYAISASPTTAAAPELSPPGGTYSGVTSVTLSCATTSPVIYYTTDGSAPTRSSAPYSTPITVSATTTVRAICTASGYADSAESAATYTLGGGGDITGELLAAAMGVPISRGAQAYASAGAAVDAGSDDYEVGWSAPADGGWLAYDLSSVAATHRGRVYVHWQVPNLQRYDYRWDATPNPPHKDDGIPGPFVIEASSNSTNGSDGSWMVLFADASVQEWKSRVIEVDMAGHTWLRFRGTGRNPEFTGGTSLTLKIDVFDASAGDDAVALFGDSITGEAWRWYGPSARVNLVEAGAFPLCQPSGIAFLTTGMVLEDWWELGGPSHPGVSWFDKWLALFPGKYVSLAYGTNDTNGGGYDRARFVGNMRELLRKTIAAGKVPIMPGMPWNSPNEGNIEDALAALGLLRSMWVAGQPPSGSLLAETEFAGKVLVGPDLYGTFRRRTDLIDAGGADLHPTGAGTNDTGTSTGYGVYRQAWADWIRQSFYSR